MKNSKECQCFYTLLSLIFIFGAFHLVLNTSRDLLVIEVIKAKTDAQLVQNTNFSLILF